MRPELFPVEPTVPPEGWREEARMGTPLRHSVPEWREIVIRAYAAQPTLSLTWAQGQRLWAMDPSTCGYVLDSLVESGVLTRTPAGQYCRADVMQPLDSAAAM
jgi:hypothetical protein